MSQAPFSKPDVNDVVSSSPVFKIRPSLNHWSGGRLSKARGKHLFGLVVIALLLLGLQLTACGTTANPPISSASPTSNSTSQPNTPSTTSAPGSTTASTTTAGPTTTVPTTGPTTGSTPTPTTGSTPTPTAVPTSTPTAVPTSTPTAVPPPDPGSFTVSQLGVSFSGVAGLSDPATQQILLTYTAAGPLTWSVSASTTDGANWLSVDPSSDTMSNNTENITITASNLKAKLPPGSYMGTLSFTPVNPKHDNTVSVDLLVGPGVLSINPTNGPAAGGTSVVISGYGFTGATGVLFGSVAASNFTINNDTQITVVSPAGSGTVDVTVTNPGFTSLITAGDKFTYNSAPPGPVVSSISPTSGPAAGGTSVTITGSGFTGATGVSFGGTAASNVIVVSDTQITATSPAGSGTVDVTVKTPNGTSTTGAADQFKYT